MAAKPRQRESITACSLVVCIVVLLVTGCTHMVSGVSGFAPSWSPVARAVGPVNCLVEVYVNFLDPIEESADPTGSVQSTAIDLAHAMMDKITTPS
jgi:hypothetical protein